MSESPTSETARHKPVRSVDLLIVPLGTGPAAVVVALPVAWVAGQCGWMFAGLNILTLSALAGLLCAPLAGGLALYLWCRSRPLTWRLWLRCLLLAAPLTLLIVGKLDHRRSLGRLCGRLSPEVQFQYGEVSLFQTRAHFSGRPAAITEIVQRLKLVPFPAEYREAGILPRHAQSFGWWRPLTMPGAQYWSVSWDDPPAHALLSYWINGATNEVFACLEW